MRWVGPFDVQEKYGTDALRYYMLAKVHPWEDSDFSYEKFEAAYTSDLANGLGNLVARVAGMAGKAEYKGEKDSKRKPDPGIVSAINSYRFDEALKVIWDMVRAADVYVNEHEVWKLEGAEKQKALSFLVDKIREIAFNLHPFLPETAEKIKKQYEGEVILAGENLFPRLLEKA
jgi:methionyl-tRNA synthetase